MKEIATHKKELVTLRKRAMKNGGYGLQLDYTMDGVRFREALKMYLVPEKTKLDKIKNQETLKAAETIVARKIIDLQNGKAGIRRRRGEKTFLLDYMEERAQVYDKRKGYSYAQTVRNTKHYVEGYRGKKVLLSQVSKEYLLGFIDYLKDTELSESTQYLYYHCLAIVLNSAVREDIIFENPSKRIEARVKPQCKEGKREFLTLDEVKVLMGTPCKDRIMKKAFLFSCFTGLRVSDIRQLRWEDIVETGSGLQIQKVMQKTGDLVYVPISANAARWLPSRRPGKVFPGVPVSPTLERRLFAWVLRAGLTKHITFHCARHTNATLMLTYGTDIYTVSKLLGHKDIKTTEIYAKIIDDKKRQAVESIPEIC